MALLLNAFWTCTFKESRYWSIYLALVKTKIFQVSNIVGMGFDGAATFSGKKTG